jgi:hypothetical protein
VAETADRGLVLESIVGGDAAVGDVLEMEVVVPRGEEMVVVTGGDYSLTPRHRPNRAGGLLVLVIGYWGDEIRWTEDIICYILLLLYY